MIFYGRCTGSFTLCRLLAAGIIQLVPYRPTAGTHHSGIIPYFYSLRFCGSHCNKELVKIKQIFPWIL